MYFLIPAIFLLFQLNPGTKSASTELNAILQKLIEERGEVRDDYPSIRIIDRVKNIASYSALDNEILVEQRAYELCKSLGADSEAALAFLIGHELTHFFQERDWNKGKSSMAFYADHLQFDALKEAEAEADRYGAFLLYLSGYDYFRIAPKIIDLLYDDYQINASDGSPYPSTEERKALVLEVCNSVNEYTLLFQAANYLQMIGKYDSSQAVYEYLLRYLDLPEIYHNAGTNQLKAVLAQKSYDFEYPLQVIHELSLREELTKTPAEHLWRAVQNLETAATKNPAGYTSFINLAVAYIQLNREADAKFIFDQLKSLKSSKEVHEQIALIETEWFDDPNAKKEQLHKLLDKTSSDYIASLCRRNLDLLERSDSSKFRTNARQQKEFIPKTIDFGLSTLNRILIDRSDPLFPLTAEIYFGPGKYVCLSRGESNIEIFIWQDQELQLDEPAEQPIIYSNADNPFYQIILPVDQEHADVIYIKVS